MIQKITEPNYRAVFLAWERFRIPYLTAYLATHAVILIKFWRHVDIGIEFWAVCGTYFILANLFYMLGPTVESYIAFLGWRIKPLRMALWVVGTLFACVIVWLVISGYNRGFYYKLK